MEDLKQGYDALYNEVSKNVNQAIQNLKDAKAACDQVGTLPKYIKILGMSYEKCFKILLRLTSLVIIGIVLARV